MRKEGGLTYTVAVVCCIFMYLARFSPPAHLTHWAVKLFPFLEKAQNIEISTMSEGTSGKLNLENVNFLMGLKQVGSSQVKDLTVEKERLIIMRG